MRAPRLLAELHEARGRPPPHAPSSTLRAPRTQELERALKVFSEILLLAPGAHFKIIGPDNGIKNDLKAQVEQLGIAKSVTESGVSL